MLFVTHNLPLVRLIAQQVAVLATGRIVESATTRQVLTDPKEPYTRELHRQHALPRDGDRRARRRAPHRQHRVPGAWVRGRPSPPS